MSSNIPPSIESKIGAALHNKSGHPIKIIKNLIYDYFNTFDHFDNLKCQVKVK